MYKPKNIPKGDAGMLLVTGDEASVIKQVWICDGENPEVFQEIIKVKLGANGIQIKGF